MLVILIGLSSCTKIASKYKPLDLSDPALKKVNQPNKDAIKYNQIYFGYSEDIK